MTHIGTIKDLTYFIKQFDKLNSKHSKPRMAVHANLVNTVDTYDSEKFRRVAHLKLDDFEKRSSEAVAWSRGDR